MAPPPKTAEASTAHADGGLDVDRFVARRRDDWQELERLLDLFDARALSLDSAR
jgi:hypothetical protein